MKLPAMTEEQLRMVFPHLAALADANCDGAQDVLGFMEMGDVRLHDYQVEAIEQLVERYGTALFPNTFGNQEVMRFRFQFTMDNLVTAVFEISDDNYAACGVSFDGNRPVWLHINDRSYSAPCEGVYDDVLEHVYQQFAEFWAIEEGNNHKAVGPIFTTGKIIPPLVDCRLGLNEPEALTEAAVMHLVSQMVKEYSPYAADVLFNSEQPGYDIITDTFKLRTYNRHSGDNTHTWNFVWRDFAVQWYGRISRDPTFNRRLTSNEVVALLNDVWAGLAKHTFPPEPTPPKPLTPERLQAMTSKLQRNGRSGAFDLPTDEERRMLLLTFNSRYGATHSGDPIITDAEALRLYREQKNKSDK